MEKKIIFFDIDGTLYTPVNNGVTQIVKNAIQETRKKGHLCFIASGRPYGFIADNVKEIGFDGYVLANGANIKYKGQDLQTRYLNEYDVKTFIMKLKEKNIEYVLQTSTFCYIEQKQRCLLDFYTKCNIDFQNFRYDFEENDIFKQTIKIEIWVKDEEELEYVLLHNHAFAFELHPDHHSIEVYAKNVSKSTGILDVLDLLNIDKQESYCFGDGPNDIETISSVGCGVAMENALLEVKKIAKNITLSNNDNGVAKFIKNLKK